MIPAAYLDVDAAHLADAELSRTVPVPLRTVPNPVLQELDYAVDLFRRAEKAISEEVRVLRGQPLPIDWPAVQGACFTLLSAAVAMNLFVQVERVRRPA